MIHLTRQIDHCIIEYPARSSDCVTNMNAGLLETKAGSSHTMTISHYPEVLDDLLQTI